jgi:lysophospholipase L1-like esterase
MRVSSSRRLRDAGLFLLITMLLLAAVETAAHLLTVRESRDALPRAPGADAVSLALARLDLNLVPLDRDLDFLWRNRASVEKRQPTNPQPFGRHDEWTLVHNARGFRNVEPIRSEKLPDELRILCIGDSITYGFNVDQADSYPERLQAALRARYPGRPITVINAATPGWSWVQGLRLLEREGVGLRPDVVIMAHGTNDRFFSAKTTDAEWLGHLSRPGVRWVESLRLTLRRTATYRLIERWFAPRSDGTEEMSVACRMQTAHGRRCNRVGLEEIETSIATANRVAMDASASLLVLNLDFQETDAVMAVRNGVQRAHVPFVDVVALYLNRRAGDERARERRLGLAAAVMPTARASRKQGAARVLFRIVVPPGAASVDVEGGTLLGPTTFRVALNDEGRGGDEIAADGVWSGRVENIPLNEGPLRYAFVRDGVPELRALPPFPSTYGRRKRQLMGDAILPVEVLGDLYLMAETTHPNADGQALIAERVLEALAELPGFTRWSALHEPQSVEGSRG